MPYKDPEKQRIWKRNYERAKRAKLKQQKQDQFNALLFSENKKNEPKSLILKHTQQQIINHHSITNNLKRAKNAEKQRKWKLKNQIQRNLLCQCFIFCCKKTTCQTKSTIFSLRDNSYFCDNCYQNRYIN